MPTVEALFDGSAATVGRARSWARKALKERRVCPEVREDALLILCELATNAVQHSWSGAPGGTYRAVLDLDETRMRITVVDLGGIGYPRPKMPTTSPEEDLEVNGRGLGLIDQISHTWWISTTNRHCAVTVELVLNGGQQ